MKMGVLCKKISSLLLAGAFFFALFPFHKRVIFAYGEKNKENPFGWDKLSAYTTYYNTKDRGRCENIAIAASLIDGITLQAYGEFSFNQTVGRRTEEFGFQQAKIIVNGEYVLGVGGGVCQVSTTLYNAALKAGLEVWEFYPHSLKVSYVAPSRDAMVSTHNDLKLFNPYAHSIYISAVVFDGGVKISVFGKNEGYRYELSSKIIEEIAPPAPIVKEGEKEEVLRQEQAGIKSEMYLERYKRDKLLFRKRLRKDFYRPIQGIIVKKVENPTNKMCSNDCLFSKKML